MPREIPQKVGQEVVGLLKRFVKIGSSRAPWLVTLALYCVLAARILWSWGIGSYCAAFLLSSPIARLLPHPGMVNTLVDWFPPVVILLELFGKLVHQAHW